MNFCKERLEVGVFYTGSRLVLSYLSLVPDLLRQLKHVEQF